MITKLKVMIQKKIKITDRLDIINSKKNYKKVQIKNFMTIKQFIQL